jgi:hypothetical protein
MTGFLNGLTRSAPLHLVGDRRSVTCSDATHSGSSNAYPSFRRDRWSRLLSSTKRTLVSQGRLAVSRTLHDDVNPTPIATLEYVGRERFHACDRQGISGCVPTGTAIGKKSFPSRDPGSRRSGNARSPRFTDGEGSRRKRPDPTPAGENPEVAEIHEARSRPRRLKAPALPPARRPRLRSRAARGSAGRRRPR